MKKQDRDKRAEQIADAIGELPEQMICDALEFEKIRRKQKRKRRHRIEAFGGLVAAAVICIIVLYGSDHTLIPGRTADIDKTEEKTALKASDQMQSASQEELDIWCMASGPEDEVTVYSDCQDESSDENADVKKERGTDNQKESRGESKDKETAPMPEKNTSENDPVSAGEQLQAGERQLLHTNIIGKGENKKVQFALQFGETDNRISYTLKASRLSMELIAENDKEQKKIILQGNKKSKITCVSGTQIGCSLRFADITDKTVSPSISVSKKNNKTGERIKGEIKVEQRGGKYYLYLTEK